MGIPPDFSDFTKTGGTRSISRRYFLSAFEAFGTGLQKRRKVWRWIDNRASYCRDLGRRCFFIYSDQYNFNYRWSDVFRNRSFQCGYQTGFKCRYFSFTCRWKCTDEGDEKGSRKIEA